MLIDTNIFIEIGKEQQHRKACSRILRAVSIGMINEEVYISKFSLSAIEAILSASTPFIREILLLILHDKIKVKDTSIDDDLMINSVKNDLGLDFDDSLQFVLANKLQTYLVTYDKDFSHTSLQTKTPEEVLEELAISV